MLGNVGADTWHALRLAYARDKGRHIGILPEPPNDDDWRRCDEVRYTLAKKRNCELQYKCQFY